MEIIKQKSSPYEERNIKGYFLEITFIHSTRAISQTKVKIPKNESRSIKYDEEDKN